MDWQAALRARLLAAAPVTALVAQRIYWLERPQGTALPAVTLQTISDERPQHMKGFDGFRSARVQIDVWAASLGSSIQIVEAVIAALAPKATSNGIRFDRAFVDSLREMVERNDAQTSQTIFRKSMDLIIHHATA